MPTLPFFWDVKCPQLNMSQIKLVDSPDPAQHFPNVFFIRLITLASTLLWKNMLDCHFPEDHTVSSVPSQAGT